MLTSTIKLLLGVAILAALLIFSRALDWPERWQALAQLVRDLGPTGALFFVLIYAAGAVLFLPGWIFTVGAGALFGVARGASIALAGATLGATGAFLIGRYLARDWVTRKMANRPGFRAIDEAVGREGWKIVGLIRLSPIFPFNLLNYAFGVTRVSLRDYFWASAIGMLPGAVLYAYLGALAGDLSGVTATGRERTTWEWAFYLAGLLATVAVTIYVTRLARQALLQRVRDPAP